MLGYMMLKKSYVDSAPKIDAIFNDEWDIIIYDAL